MKSFTASFGKFSDCGYSWSSLHTRNQEAPVLSLRLMIVLRVGRIFKGLIAHVSDYLGTMKSTGEIGKNT